MPADDGRAIDFVESTPGFARDDLGAIVLLVSEGPEKRADTRRTLRHVVQDRWGLDRKLWTTANRSPNMGETALSDEFFRSTVAIRPS
jgi:hypothetical protein